MTNNYYWKKLFFINLFLSLLLLSVFLLFIFWLFNHSGVFGGSIITSEESNSYVFTEIDLSKDETTTRYGFIQIPQTLEEEEYLTYSNPSTSSFYVISNFGGEKYECTGSCYCDNERRKVVSSSLSRKGLNIILLAFSSTMAFSIAQEVFKEDCMNLAECENEDTIVSDVEQCIRKDELVDSYKEYRCKGYCYENPNIMKLPNSKHYQEEGLKLFGMCEKYVMEDTIVPMDVVGENWDLTDRSTEGMEKTHSSMLKYLFMGSKLRPFCESMKVPLEKLDNDMISMLFDDDGNINKDGMFKDVPPEMLAGLKDMRNGITFCSALDETQFGKKGLNELLRGDFKNVECFEK